jgi:hypothetical protein
MSNAAMEMIMALVNNQGVNAIGSAVQILLNETMKVERSRYLGANPYERLRLSRICCGRSGKHLISNRPINLVP